LPQTFLLTQQNIGIEMRTHSPVTAAWTTHATSPACRNTFVWSSWTFWWRTSSLYSCTMFLCLWHP
jgi:hypothetical protein